MLKRKFLKYVLVGVANTAIHWAVFAILFYGLYVSQAYSNLCAFLVAVTFSFFVNAKLTFNKKASGKRYMAFIIFMGGISYLNGYVSDHFEWHPLVTLVIFSGLSLVLGFLYSNYIVFNKDSE